MKKSNTYESNMLLCTIRMFFFQFESGDDMNRNKTAARGDTHEKEQIFCSKSVEILVDIHFVDNLLIFYFRPHSPLISGSRIEQNKNHNLVKLAQILIFDYTFHMFFLSN